MDSAPANQERDEEPGRADRLEEGLHALYAMLLSEESLEDTLRRVAELAAATLPACDLADITLIRDGRPVTKGATDPRAHDLDEIQYELGDGPCLDAWRHDRVTHLESTRTDTRWPQFAAAATQAGVLSTLAIPLSVQGAVIGAINLHSSRERSFTDADEQIGRLFATQAAIALHNARTHDTAVALAEQLHEALETRVIIEQAIGVLIARHRCSPQEAFDQLVDRSQHENCKLRLIADDLVRDAQQSPEHPRHPTS